MINDPLTQYMLCSPGEGGVAIVLCRGDLARRYTTTPVFLRSVVTRTRRFGSFEVFSPWLSVDRGTSPTEDAAQAAFEQAGIGPDEVQVAQVQDTDAGSEIIHMAETGLCAHGDQAKLIAEGQTEIGGALPINTDGGCLASGEPIGASGLRQVYETVLQLRGDAGARQVPGEPNGWVHPCLRGARGECLHGAGAMSVTITTEDVDELRTVLRDFLETLGDSARVREVMETDTGIDDALWRRMADELGCRAWPYRRTTAAPVTDCAVHLAVFEELGRSLACVPYLSTVGLAIPALLASGNAALQHELLPSLAAGRRPRPSRSSRPTATGRSPTAGPRRPCPDMVTLTGRKTFVLDGCSADVILVLACRPTDWLYRRRHRTRPESARRCGPSTSTRRMATLDFHDAPARLVTRRGRAVVAHALDLRTPRLPPSSSGERSAAWRCRWSTRVCGSSSVGRSAASRRSNTGVPTCCSRWSRHDRRSTI